jgi:hypothetical protein
MAYEKTSDFNTIDVGIEMKMKSHPHTEWTREHETILVEWADKAMCFRWLHAKSHQIYAKMLMWFTIPVIIMSTTTGTANFAQDKIPLEYRSYAAMLIGAVNIFAGILTTIQQFLKVSELNEAHRVASISWDKFYRNTKVELSKSPNERVPVIQLLKSSKDEFDRLMETSPSISSAIIDDFKTTFSDGLSKIKGKIDRNNLSNRQAAYLDLIKPEICDSIESIANSIYKHPDETATKDKKHSLSDLGLARSAVALKEKQDKIEKIISVWTDKYKRRPTTQEIMDELDGAVAIQVVENYIVQQDKLELKRASCVIDILPKGNENV